MDDTRPHPDRGAPVDAGDLRPGRVLGSCVIERKLGRGGMGEVYLARHRNLEVPVALKVLHHGRRRGARDVEERFLREARLAARLDHPNVVRVLDADRDAATGLCYIVQEFVEGGTLADRVDGGPIEEEVARQILVGVLGALAQAAAKGIVHRDIKPENILLTADGEPKLADLGLAKELGLESNLTATRTTMGTPAYMSPEQIRDSKRTDVRSDLYSLGATFYHLLVGHAPFRGENAFAVLHQVVHERAPDPRIACPEVGDDSARICLRMMEKDPDRRYQTPEEVLRDLSGLAPVPRARPSRRRTGLLVAGFAGGVVAVLLVLSAVIRAPGPAPEVSAPGSGFDPELVHGVILALDFEEPIRDAGPEARAVRVAGGLATGEGRVGRAAVFDGVDDRLVLDPIEVRSIAFWFRVDSNAMACWFSAGDNDPPPGRSFLVGTWREEAYTSWQGLGQGVFVGFFGTEVLLPIELAPGAWHHFAFAWDGSQAGRVALDGEPAGGWVVSEGRRQRFPASGFRLPHPVRPDAAPGTLVGHMPPEWWRRNLSGREYFQGALDELVVWDRELAEAELRKLHAYRGRYCRPIAGR